MSCIENTSNIEVSQPLNVSWLHTKLINSQRPVDLYHHLEDESERETEQQSNVLPFAIEARANGTTGTAATPSASGPAQGGKKAKSGPPVSLRCARWFYAHGIDGMKLAAETRGRNIVVRAWNGVYWQEVFEEVAKPKLQKWLEQFAETSCTPHNVNDSWKTLRDKVVGDRMIFKNNTAKPDESKCVVLPFKDGYLHITADKAWMEAPNPDYGIKHCADVNLGLRPKQEFVPKPVPLNSQFGRYLASSLPNLETREIVQQHCAMSFMRNKYHLVGWWVGDAGVGKSVLVKMLHHVHGKDDQGRANYGAVDLTKLDGEHYLENIVDKTFLSVGEVNVSRPWCEDTFKMIVAGDALDINPKNEKIYSYQCEAFMVVCSNQAPVVRDESGGVMRRLQVVMWEGSMERRGTVVYDLDKIVFKNEPQLLVGWIVEGIQKILRRGGPVRDKDLPAEMRRFTQRLKKDNDSIEAWIVDCEIVKTRDETVEVRKREVYEHYLAYCHEACIDKPRGEAVFWKILARKMGVNIDDITRRPNLAAGGKGPAMIRTIAIKPEDIAKEKMERLREQAIAEGRFEERDAIDDPFDQDFFDAQVNRTEKVPVYTEEEIGEVRRLVEVITPDVQTTPGGTHIKFRVPHSSAKGFMTAARKANLSPDELAQRFALAVAADHSLLDQVLGVLDKKAG